jgi:hypothetical protein
VSGEDRSLSIIDIKAFEGGNPDKKQEISHAAVTDATLDE